MRQRLLRVGQRQQVVEVKAIDRAPGEVIGHEPGLEALEVPDPYYGAPEDFERVLDLAERGAAGLLDVIRATFVAYEADD